MVFDGSIENITCITQHQDYDAITNRAVLLHVAPLLRNKDGGTYHHQKTSSLFTGGGRMGEKMGGSEILATAKRGALGKIFVIEGGS